jgi:hypothetical protein
MRTGGQGKGKRETDMTKLIFAFDNFANALKNISDIYIYIYSIYILYMQHLFIVHRPNTNLPATLYKCIKISF